MPRGGRVPIERVVAERVRARREAQGLSQVELARIVGTSRSHVTAIERGEKTPTVTTLDALARALQTSIGDLVGETAGTKVAEPVDPVRQLARALRARGPGYVLVLDRMVKLLDRFLREERPSAKRARRPRAR